MGVFFVAKDNQLIFKEQTKLVILHDGSHGYVLAFKGNSNHWAMRNPRRNLTYYSGSLVHTNQVPKTPFFAELLLS